MLRQAVLELRLIKAQLDLFLARGAAEKYRDMRQVAPGVWLNNRYETVAECLAECLPSIK